MLTLRCESTVKLIVVVGCFQLGIGLFSRIELDFVKSIQHRDHGFVVVTIRNPPILAQKCDYQPGE